MKPLLPLLFAAVLLPAMTFAQTTIVNDSWADANRANTGPLQADWWSSSASSSGNNTSVEVGAGYMGLVTGTSGRGLHGTFAPQTLGIGNALTATFTFRTPATVGSESGGGGFRFGMADFNAPGLAADLQSSTSFVQPLFQNLPAYMVDFDVNRPGVADDTSVRKHTIPNSTGRLLGTTTEWTQVGTSTDVDYTFAANTEYVAVISLTMTANGMDIFGSLSQGSTLLTSYTYSDTSAIVDHIGMVGVFANSSLFGSSATIGAADNGIDFTNFKLEFVPEPSSAALLLAGALIFGKSLWRRR